MTLPADHYAGVRRLIAFECADHFNPDLGRMVEAPGFVRVYQDGDAWRYRPCSRTGKPRGEESAAYATSGDAWGAAIGW